MSAKKRRALRKKLVVAWTEQEGLCFYCDKPTWIPGMHPKTQKGLRATAEHLIRKCEGGNNSQENIAMACVDCNNRRADADPMEWIAERGGEVPGDETGCTYFGSHARGLDDRHT